MHFSNKREDLFELTPVVNIFGKDVFVQGIPGGTVDEQHVVFLVIAGQFAEKVPASILFVATGRGFELGSRPEDGSFCTGIEPFRIEHCPLVVISQKTHAELHHAIDTLAWIGAVPHDVSQAIDFVDVLGRNVGQHGPRASRLL